MPSESRRPSLGLLEFRLGSKASERPVKKCCRKLFCGGTPEPTAVFAGAVNQGCQAEQQRRVPQSRGEREWKPAAPVGLQVHGDGVEAWNVGDGVVDEGVEGHGVRSAVGKGEEGVARCVGQAGAEASEYVGWVVVFERVMQAGKVCEGTGAGTGQGADGEQLDLCAGLGSGDDAECKGN